MGVNGKRQFRDGHGREPENLDVNRPEVRQEFLDFKERTKQEMDRLLSDFLATLNAEDAQIAADAKKECNKIIQKLDRLKSVEAVEEKKGLLHDVLEKLKSKKQAAPESAPAEAVLAETPAEPEASTVDPAPESTHTENIAEKSFFDQAIESIQESESVHPELAAEYLAKIRAMSELESNSEEIRTVYIEFLDKLEALERVQTANEPITSEAAHAASENLVAPPVEPEESGVGVEENKNTELLAKAADELDQLAAELRADDYGENAEKAADLISESIRQIQSLDHNLTNNGLNKAITKINETLEKKLEELKITEAPVEPEQAPADAEEDSREDGGEASLLDFQAINIDLSLAEKEPRSLEAITQNITLKLADFEQRQDQYPAHQANLQALKNFWALQSSKIDRVGETAYTSGLPEAMQENRKKQLALMMEAAVDIFENTLPDSTPAGASPETPVPAEQEKLKLVDIKPEKIKEILQNTEVVASLKTLLLNAEAGGGAEAFRANIVLVLNQYFTEQNLPLSADKQTQLEQMIANLSNEVAQQVTDSFAIALEAKATKEMQDDGFLQKIKKNVVSLTGAQFGTTLAVGIGASALVTLFAPAAIGVVGGIAATGLLAGFGRFGVSLGFDKLRQVLSRKEVLSEKEQLKLQASKQDILSPEIPAGAEPTKAEFVNLDFLSAVIANTIRTNTSEDFMQGHVRNEDGTLSVETLDTLKQNIENLLNNDPRYAHLDGAAKREEAKKLMTVLGLNLVQEADIFFDFKNEAADPKMIQAMKRAQGFLSGKVNTDNKLAQAGAAMLVGAGMKLAYSSSKTVAASTGALSGALMGWSFGAGLERARAAEEYSLQLEKMLNNGESRLLETVSMSDMQGEDKHFDGEKFSNLENDAIRIKNLLAAKDETGHLIADPVLRARAENFVHQFNQVQARELHYGASENAPGGPIFENIERALNGQQELLDNDREFLREVLAKKVAKGVSETRRKKLALAAIGGIGFGLFGLVMGGSADAAENNTGAADQEASVQDTIVAPSNSSEAPVDSLSAEDIDSDEVVSEVPVDGDGAAVETPVAEAPVDDAGSVDNAGAGAENPNSDGGVENVPDQAATAVTSTHEVTATETGALENVIRTEKGMQGHDSIWNSTKDIVKSDPEKFGYTGELDDTGSIAKFADIKTAELVSQLEQAHSGDLADLVHDGDKVIVNFEGDKAILSFEASSGIEAGHLPDFTAKAEAPVDNVPSSAPVGAPVGPEMPVANMENFISGKAPYSPELLKSIIDKPAELNTLAEKIFESATPETQKQFLHDLYPDSFTDATNKAAVFLHYVENAPDVNVKDLNNVSDLDNWLKNFDAQANSDELPGRDLEVRLLTDENGKTFYAMVWESKKHLFAQDDFKVNDLTGGTSTIKEKVLESWLKNSEQALATPAPVVEPATLPVPEPIVEPTEPAPTTPAPEAPAVPENISSSGRMDNVQLEGGQELNFNYDETGKITGVEMSGRISGDTEMLKDDFRGILSSKLGRLTPDAVTAVQTTARVINLNTEFLNHLVETGQANTPEADFLADKILNDINKVEKLYGDVFKDIKPSLDGKIEFVDAVQPSAQVEPESAPTPPAENPVETPVEPELTSGAPRSFEQLSQMKDGAEYRHDDLIIFKKDGALFTLDVMGKEPLLIRNQADLDRFAGK